MCQVKINVKNTFQVFKMNGDWQSSYTRLGMSVTTQGGSGRQSITGSWRLCSCAGRQITGFRRQILGFGRQLLGVTYKSVAENDNIVLFACLDLYYHLSVC